MTSKNTTSTSRVDMAPRRRRNATFRAQREIFFFFALFDISEFKFLFSRFARFFFLNLKFQNPNFGFFLRARARSTRFSEKSKKNICGYHPPPGFFLYNTHTLTQCYAPLRGASILENTNMRILDSSYS